MTPEGTPNLKIDTPKGGSDSWKFIAIGLIFVILIGGVGILFAGQIFKATGEKTTGMGPYGPDYGPNSSSNAPYGTTEDCNFPVDDPNWRNEHYDGDNGIDIGVGPKKGKGFEPINNNVPPNESILPDRVGIIAIANGTLVRYKTDNGQYSDKPWWQRHLHLRPDNPSSFGDNIESFFYQHITEIEPSILSQLEKDGTARVTRGQILGWIYKPSLTYHLHFGIGTPSGGLWPVHSVGEFLNTLKQRCDNRRTSKCLNGYREPITYNQYAEPWASMQYGHNTFANSGCGPSASAMALTSLGFNANPKQLMEIYLSNGLRQSFGSAPPSTSVIANTFKGVVVRQTNWEGAKKAISEGKPVVFNAIRLPFTKGGHYVTLWGYRNNEFGVYDSGYFKVKSASESQILNAKLSPTSFWVFEKGSDFNIEPCKNETATTVEEKCKNLTTHTINDGKGTKTAWVEAKTQDGQSFCVEMRDSETVKNALKNIIAKLSGFPIKEIVGYGERPYKSSYHPTGCAIDINRADNPYFDPDNGYKLTILSKAKGWKMDYEPDYTSTYSNFTAFKTALNGGTNPSNKYILSNDVINTLTSGTGWSHPYIETDRQHFQFTGGDCKRATWSK